SGSNGAFLGVSNSPASAAFTDPTTNLTQNDPFSNNVYVAWATNWVGDGDDPNPSAIALIGSSDGGKSFTPATILNDSRFTSDIELDARPRIAISQGTIDGKVAPGQVSVIWDDYGSGNLLNPLIPPRDFLHSDSLAAGVS